MQAGSTSTQQAIHYQTIEDKRISLYKALLIRPDDLTLKAKLQNLSTPQQIRQAAKDGIFINYSRADEISALELTTTLRKANQKPWLDVLDVYGSNWRSEVVQALNRCGLMVTILSRRNMIDLDSERERRYFIQQGKIVVPVIYENGITTLPPYLTMLPLEQEQHHGLSALMNLLQSTDANGLIDKTNLSSVEQRV